MFLQMMKFELTYFRRQPSFYVVALIFFLFTFFSMISDNVHIGSSSNVHFNAPHAITQTLMVMSLIGMFLVANFVGGTAVRDISHKMDGIMLSTPVSKTAYLWGRLAGALLFCLLVFAAAPLGMLIGSFWPTVDAERLGPTMLSPYFWSYVVFVIPNFLFCSVLFYAMALKARSMMGMYLGIIGFFILYEMSGTLLANPEWLSVAALLDPFGVGAFRELTRYWTPFERNTQLVPLTGDLLTNRVLWLSISAVILALTHWRMDIRKPIQLKQRKTKIDKQTVPVPVALHRPNPAANNEWLRLRTRIGFEVAQIVKSAPFAILCLFSVFSLLTIFFDSNGMFGTDNWPVTRDMSEYIIGVFVTMALIVVTYYSGETVWRERQLGIGDIVEATPIKNWTIYFPKMIGLTTVTVVLTLTGIAFTVAYQIIKGYTHFEWGVYAGLLSLQFVLPMAMMSVLAVFMQVLSPGKYIGMLLFVAFFITNLTLRQFGFEHHMWQFASTPSTTYSDLNQYGHFLRGELWYNVYWSMFCTILLVLGFALWPRGREYALKHRIRTAPRQMGRVGIAAMIVAAVGFVSTGFYIYHNTRVMNDYLTQNQRMDKQAEYEKKYAQYKTNRVPTITDVVVNVDFYPGERRVASKGHYLLQNNNNVPLHKVMLTWDAGKHRHLKFSVPQAKEVDRDDEFGVTWLVFEPALQAGEKTRMEFEFERANVGFVDSAHDNRVVANGSFVNNSEIMPHFGYNKEAQLVDRHERRKRDLPAPERMAKLEDSSQYGNSFTGPEADFINFETVISTSSEQTAIAPGYLQREWTENGRRYFHYKMDAPMMNFFAFLSGTWQVTRDLHNGIKIEVYHHPTHDKNVQRMIEATKSSLDYFGKQFSPYQHRQVRILEFPRYEQFAQSFANTIPYSEDIGFLADLRDPDSTDYVYFVTAHEMAHQWWGHQVSEANVQGGAVLSETLAEYSAYMVMEEKLGKDHLRKFLKFELDRYLRGRITEVLEEMPLYRAENQTYIHYQKGGIVMYALRDRFGADVINAALRNFLQEYQYKSDPYPTTLDLLRHLKAVIPVADHDFIADLFERITIFDLKVKTATAKKLDSGQYELQLVIDANKFYADGKGEETKASINDQFDIGVFSADPDKAKGSEHVLHLSKHTIKTGENTITLLLDRLPEYAGIDPYIKMIDRQADDNLKKVELQ